jgi:hypothetical protein
MDIPYNDAAGFILAEHHKLETIFGRNKNELVKLAEREVTVSVRFFSAADGSNFDGGKFKLEIFDADDGFELSAIRVD